MENRATVGSHIFKGSVLALPIEKVGWRDGEVAHPREAFGGRHVPNLHDSGGVLVGERAQENGVHQGEDCGVGANAQSEQEDGGDGETGVAKEDAKAELQVGEEVTHKKALLAADERQVDGDMSCMETD